jgi:ABC-2 type transport system permease protein
VFPMISLEGQRFWILGLAPIERSQIMWSKFYFAFGGTALISVPFSALSNWYEHSSPLVFAVQVWTSLLIAFGLSGLTVGMGALFPNFKARDPSKIVSGFGGTLTLIVSIGLVAFSVCGGGLLFHRFMVLPQVDMYAWRPMNDLVWAGPFLAFITLFNLAAGTIPMILGVRALEKVEF